MKIFYIFQQHPIHLIILIDSYSYQEIGLNVQNLILEEKPRLDVSYKFININTVEKQFQKDINFLKQYFTSDSISAKKYTDDLNLELKKIDLRMYEYKKIENIDDFID